MRARTSPGGPVHLQAMAARVPAAAKALIAAARTEYPGRTMVVGQRAGLSLRHVLGAAVPIGRRKWLYVRIADPATLLRHLWPVLDARLAASPFASASGRIDISFYRSGTAIGYRGGRVTEVSATAGDRPGRSQPEVHIPPDLFPRLLFGAGYVLDWENDPDVDLGPHRDLIGALLPPVQSDVLIW